MAMLWSIAEVQVEFKDACSIDSDGDGIGEFGFFGELGGRVPPRVTSPAPGELAPEGTVDSPLTPLAERWTYLKPDDSGDGVVEVGGYFFRIYLGGANAGPIPEDPAGGMKAENLAAGWDVQDCEEHWCAYAWPVKYEKTGRRAFFIDQRGELFGLDNREEPYSGLRRVPDFETASLTRALVPPYDEADGWILLED